MMLKSIFSFCGHEAPTLNRNYRSRINTSSVIGGSVSSIVIEIPLIVAHDVVITCALLHTDAVGGAMCLGVSDSLKNVSFTRNTVSIK